MTVLILFPMTTETKCYIDLSDIVGIELTCPNCKATIVHTLERFKDSSYPCPNCKVQVVAQNYAGDEILGNFANFLKLTQGLKVPARIRLQVTNGRIANATSVS